MTHNHEVLEGRKKVEVVEVHGLFVRMCAITLFLPIPDPFDCLTPWLNWALVLDCLLIESLLIVGQAQGKASQARSNCPRDIKSMSKPCLQCLVRMQTWVKPDGMKSVSGGLQLQACEQIDFCRENRKASLYDRGHFGGCQCCIHKYRPC